MTQLINNDSSMKRVSPNLPISMKNDISETLSAISLSKFLLHQMNLSNSKRIKELPEEDM